MRLQRPCSIYNYAFVQLHSLHIGNGSQCFAVTGSSHVEQFICCAGNTRSVFYRAFKDLTLQQLSTAACSAFVVTSSLIYAVYVCPYYYYYYYYSALLVHFFISGMQ